MGFGGKFGGEFSSPSCGQAAAIVLFAGARGGVPAARLTTRRPDGVLSIARSRP